MYFKEFYYILFYFEEINVFKFYKRQQGEKVLESLWEIQMILQGQQKMNIRLENVE